MLLAIVGQEALEPCRIPVTKPCMLELDRAIYIIYIAGRMFIPVHLRTVCFHRSLEGSTDPSAEALSIAYAAAKQQGNTTWNVVMGHIGERL